MKFAKALTLAATTAYTVQAQDTYGLSTMLAAIQSDLATDISWW